MSALTWVQYAACKQLEMVPGLLVDDGITDNIHAVANA